MANSMLTNNDNDTTGERLQGPMKERSSSLIG